MHVDLTNRGGGVDGCDGLEVVTVKEAHAPMDTHRHANPQGSFNRSRLGGCTHSRELPGEFENNARLGDATTPQPFGT